MWAQKQFNLVNYKAIRGGGFEESPISISLEIYNPLVLCWRFFVGWFGVRGHA